MKIPAGASELGYLIPQRLSFSSLLFFIDDVGFPMPPYCCRLLISANRLHRIISYSIRPLLFSLPELQNLQPG